MLIFLERNWLKTYFKENWGRISIDALTTFLPDEAPAIVSDVKEKGEKEALKIWQAYAKNKSMREQLALKCYLLPSSFLDETSCNDKEVKLKSSYDINDYVSVGIPEQAKSCQNMFAFYESSLLKAQDCVIPVTLNKTTLHLKTLSDNKRMKGLISDAQLDLSKGQMAGFIVDVMGENSVKRIVPLSQVDFDTQTIVDGKDFATCSLLKP